MPLSRVIFGTRAATKRYSNKTKGAIAGTSLNVACPHQPVEKVQGMIHRETSGHSQALLAQLTLNHSNQTFIYALRSTKLHPTILENARTIGSRAKRTDDALPATQSLS